MWVDVGRSHVRHQIYPGFGPVRLVILGTLLLVEVVAVSWDNSKEGFGIRQIWVLIFHLLAR